MIGRLVCSALSAIVLLHPLPAAADPPERYSQSLEYMAGLPISCPGCNLRGIDFKSIRMGDKRFVDSDFRESDLRGANLSNMYMLTTNMKNADLRGANLSHTFFTLRSSFLNADLRGANLNDVWFTTADLRGADLRGTNVERITTLEDADLTGARVDPDFYDRIQADQPRGICIVNTTLPNGR